MRKIGFYSGITILLSCLMLISAYILVPQLWQREKEKLHQEFLKEHRGVKQLREKNTVLNNYYGRIGAQELTGLLDKAYPYCHTEGHRLGRLIYEENKPDMATSIKICGKSCNNGCLHGLLMEAFGHNRLTPENINNGIGQVCGKRSVGAPDPPFYWSCMHGMGHAIAVSNKMDIGKATAVCNNLKGIVEKFHCIEGTYMEDAWQQYEQRGWGQPSGVSSFYPCDENFTEYPAACFYHYRRHMVKTVGGVIKMMQLCNNLAETRLKLACWRGAARESTFQGSLGNPLMIHDICELEISDKDGQRWCVESIVEILSQYRDVARDKIDTICGMLKEHRDFCKEVWQRDVTARIYHTLYLEALYREVQETGDLLPAELLSK